MLKIHYGRDGDLFVVTDPKTMQSLRLTLGEAKDVARFLMLELNVRRAICEPEPGKYVDLMETDPLLAEGRTYGESQSLNSGKVEKP